MLPTGSYASIASQYHYIFASLLITLIKASHKLHCEPHQCVGHTRHKYLASPNNQARCSHPPVAMVRLIYEDGTPKFSQYSQLVIYCIVHYFLNTLPNTKHDKCKSRCRKDCCASIPLTGFPTSLSESNSAPPLPCRFPKPSIAFVAAFYVVMCVPSG